MYAILSEGILVSLCEQPNYIKRHERTGVYVASEEADAIAVSVGGILYNIRGQEEIEKAPQAIVLKTESSEYIFRNHVRIAKNEKTTNAAIVEIEDAMCELDEVSAENMAMVENALCELDGMINGGKMA